MYYTRYRRKRTSQNDKYCVYGGVRILTLDHDGVDDEIDGVGRQHAEPNGYPSSRELIGRGRDTRERRHMEACDPFNEWRSNESLRERWGIE
jgi:hypothetical protein